MSSFFEDGALDAIVANELARELTDHGLAVDEVRPAFDSFEGVVVGRVLEVSPHPKADRLTLCTVDAGKGEQRVVCGAPNVEVGALYGYAVPGSTLPGGRTIERATIRGVESEGMLCSAPELGLDALGSAQGIWAVPGLDDGVVGGDLREILEIDDTVFVFDLTSNRGDAMSHLGVAREVHAITGARLAMPAVALAEPVGAEFEGVGVAIDDIEGCPLYRARLVEGVTIGVSPAWLQLRLAAVGQRPISNVVDVTNFVMLEVGQPLHAFDFERIRGVVTVRRAGEAERFTTLDGEERELDSSMTMITDERGSIAIGGVMGGAESEVTEATTRILLEGAHFAPWRIRDTSRALGLATEASIRFARGVDPEIAGWAIDRAATLIAAMTGATPVTSQVAADARPRDESAPIELRVSRAERVLGRSLTVEEVRGALDSLGFSIEASKNGVLRVTSPSWRFDIQGEVDLVEEVGRVVGYDSIPLAPLPAPAVAPHLPEEEERSERARRMMTALGFDEAYTPSFVTDRVLGAVTDVSKLVEMKNPIAMDSRWLRPYLFPGLGQSIAYNLNRRASRVRLFEIGETFLRAESGDAPIERRRLAFAAAGARRPLDWSATDDAALDFFDIKGDVEDLLNAFGTGRVAFVTSGRFYLHPGLQAAIVCGGVEIGFCGQVHPEVTEIWGSPAPVFVAEIDFNALPARVEPVTVTVPSREPATSRDLALVVPDSDTAEEVVSIIRSANVEDVEAIEVFDRYRGPQVGEGTYSLGIRVVFRSVRTLTDEEVDGRVSSMIERLQRERGYRLR